MKKKYFAIVEQDKDSAFGLIAPDLPMVLGLGDTLEDAMNTFEENMNIFFDYNDCVPEASSMEDIARYIAENYPSTSTKFVIAVEAVIPDKELKRINVSFSSSELEEFDKEAKSLGLTRSGFLSTAGREYISRHAMA